MGFILDPYRFTAADGFDPLTLGWDHAWWPGGPEFVAEGYGSGASVDPWPDEAASLDIVYVAGDPVTYAPTGVNSNPAIRFPGSNVLRTNARLASSWSTPYSIVIIVQWDGTGGIQFAIDGFDSTPRVQVAVSSGSLVFSTSNGDIVSDSTTDTNPHLLTMYANGASSAFEIDGTAQTDTNAGTGQLEGATVGARYSANGSYMIGYFAFMGWAQGDIRTDPAWADFEQWAADTYGVAI